ncbi:MAG: aminotransferase class I/II-fold pyridoxal phosphate-dependent enzyme [Candidatus Bathyarchaeota archaeon]|nr:aminotransferase class I/II-fold pyridoxal phosphate-dependent enzyme [Candidatus Bathyarchaeota archaeon]
MAEKDIIDLRSDTVTLPTQEMMEAIKNAELGDDVLEEDPTVNRLENIAAKKMGKQAALLVTSGTQANLISLMANTNRGEQVILEAQSHIYWYEVGGISSIAGLFPKTVISRTGAPNPKDIQVAITPKDIHFPKPSLICLENTHNRHGGTVISPRQILAISKIAKTNKLKLYMDGARIFNASIALNVDVKKLAKHVDNLMFCLSKGLSCPVGSVIVGSIEFITKARKLRKVLGGGMRQAGIIAAPGIVALEKMIKRLKEDHENAAHLAKELSKIKGVTIDLNRVQTNIVNFEISNLGISDKKFIKKLKEKNILALTLDNNKVRMVTHRGIKKENIDKTINIIGNISN